MFTHEDLVFRDYCFTNSLLTEERWKQFNDIANSYGLQDGLSRTLVEFNYFSPDDLVRLLGDAFGLPVMKLYSETNSAPKDIIPPAMMQKYRVLPMFLMGDELTVAMIDPPYKTVLDALAKATKKKIIPVIAAVDDFSETMRIQQSGFDELQRIAGGIDLKKFDISGKDANRLEQMGEFPPLIELVDELLLRAVKIGASHIHVEPFKEEVRIRFRIDGVLKRIASFPKNIADGIAAVIKTKAAMHVNEKNKIQSGRFSVAVEKRTVHVRARSIPTVNGENIVLRIPKGTPVSKKLADLGLSQQNWVKLDHLLHQPNGLILFTGPPGSGKSSTAYAAINHIKSAEKNIVTAEHPVAFLLDSVNQMNVEAERELSLAKTLKAVLQQDADVAFVSEISDGETGMAAADAALTGTLILGTLNANDAASAITQLTNTGIPLNKVSSALIGIVSQKLVRKICDFCKEEYQPTEAMLYKTGLSGLSGRVTFFRGAGCAKCSFQGYHDRIAIHEVLLITEEIQTMIRENASIATIRAAAVTNGFRDLRFDGLKKVAAGLTTLDEIYRVTRSIN